MSKINENLHDEYLDFEILLSQYDDIEIKGIDELEIASTLKSLKPDLAKDISKLRYEVFAFNVLENYNSNSIWGTYFGPYSTLENVEYPSLKILNQNALEYYEIRAIESKNPLLIARYSDLVWDLKRKVSEVSPDPLYARIAIKSYIKLVNKDYFKSHIHGIYKLKRALFLAIKINDIELIALVKNTILEKEDSLINENSIGLWGFSFDYLLNNKGVKLSTVEIQRIIENLESRFLLFSDSSEGNLHFDPWAAEAAAKRLIEYYKRLNNINELKRLVFTLGNCIMEKVNITSSAMQASGLLEHVYKLYKQFGFKEDATKILIKLRELGPKVNSEMKPISASFEMSDVKMKEYLDSMMIGNIETVLFRIIYQYLPIKDEAIKLIHHIKSKAPISFIFRHQLQDDKGRIVASIGPLTEDIDGHIVKRISDNLHLTSVFLRETLKEAIKNKGLTKNKIIGILKDSPIIEENRFEIIDEALEAYFNNDFNVFIHLIIPQLEEIFRNLIEVLGGNVLKPSSMEGYDVRTLNDILNDPLLIEALEEDLTLYLKVLFVDKRGWNLRNRVCHGIISPNILNQSTADRLLHSILCIGLIHEVK